MAHSNQSEKETVELPVPPPGRPQNPKIEPSETSRIQLPASEAAAPDSSSLKKETAAVSDMPDPSAAEGKNTEPFIATPEVATQNPAIAAPSTEKNSMALMWIVFGVSLLILIIQIWTYFS